MAILSPGKGETSLDMSATGDLRLLEWNPGAVGFKLAAGSFAVQGAGKAKDVFSGNGFSPINLPGALPSAGDITGFTKFDAEGKPVFSITGLKIPASALALIYADRADPSEDLFVRLLLSGDDTIIGAKGPD